MTAEDEEAVSLEMAQLESEARELRDGLTAKVGVQVRDNAISLSIGVVAYSHFLTANTRAPTTLRTSNCASRSTSARSDKGRGARRETSDASMSMGYISKCSRRGILHWFLYGIRQKAGHGAESELPLAHEAPPAPLLVQASKHIPWPSHCRPHTDWIVLAVP
jgi:hypothetical protein